MKTRIGGIKGGDLGSYHSPLGSSCKGGGGHLDVIGLRLEKIKQGFIHVFNRYIEPFSGVKLSF